MTGEDSAGAADTGDEEISGKRGEPVSGASNWLNCSTDL